MSAKQKTVGIIGGLSPESTVKYYEWINQGVQRHLGGHNNAKILLSSVNFAEFVALKEKGDWDTQAKMLCDEAMALEKAGADFIILATNTMHKMAEQIEAYLKIPFLHLADATANRINEDNIKTVGLLGTKYTMELDFYKKRLEAKNIEVLVPNQEEREDVNRIIYDELCHGKILNSSKQRYHEIISRLSDNGAQAVILGCTEITLLVKKETTPVTLYDTTQIHVEKTLEAIFN